MRLQGGEAARGVGRGVIVVVFFVTAIKGSIVAGLGKATKKSAEFFGISRTIAGDFVFHMLAQFHQYMR